MNTYVNIKYEKGERREEESMSVYKSVCEKEWERKKEKERENKKEEKI